MFARTALARLRAKVPTAAARDVAHLTRQLRTTALPANNARLQAPLAIRAYATATKAATKPRAAAAKKTPAKAKPAAKKTTATKKTTAAATKKKAAPAKKAAPKKKKAAPKPKKELTPEQEARLEKRKARVVEQKKKDEIKALKETALQEPKPVPATAYNILLTDLFNAPNPPPFSEAVKAGAEKYKNLSAAEREALNHRANQAKAENEKNYKKWLQSYTPLQIKQANNARRLLKTRLVSYSKSQINDDRRVKLPTSAYIAFSKERLSTNDFKDIAISDAGKRIGQEWKALSESAKAKYNQAALEDRKRYVREHKSVYGVEPEGVTI